MYKKIVRPLLFMLSPETIHHLTVRCIAISKYIPFASLIMRWCFRKNSEKLEREVFGLKFPNPVGIPAGFDKDAEI
ncbi:MAG: quinone-dependent dihydroorotate dehydrogenase, partial [Rikenellaceae bacterium]